jgi:hypothetical protein
VAYESPLKDSPNEALLDLIRNEGTDAYQARIPSATKAGVATTLRNLQTYRAQYNEFIDALVNKVGLTIANDMTWDNPLAWAKRGMLTYGNTIEEIQVGLLKAHIYDNDREALEKDVWGTERPPVQSNFHTVNRQNYYKITINEAQLQRAFLEEGGLSSFITKLMGTPVTSDNWDEFLLTCSLFSQYEANGGFYKIHVDDIASIASDETMAKAALRKMRALSRNLQFPSSKYNAAHMPTFAKPEDLILLTTPEYQAAVDVEALAGAFNIDRANFDARTVTIPQEQFGIDGAQAILTTKDFFVMADQLFETRSIQNPVGLHSNYFLHHWEVVSASRFVPAIMFWTGAGDEDVYTLTPVTSVSAITITDQNGDTPTEADRGEIYALAASAVTDPANGVNDAVRWEVSGANSPKTYITQAGVLHVGGDETATTLTVRAVAVWRDPSNLMKNPPSATITVTVGGIMVPDEWPEQDEVVTDIEVEGVSVSPTFAAATTNYTVTVGGPAPDASAVDVVGVDMGNVQITTTQTDATHTTFSIFVPTAPAQPTYTVVVTHS